MFITFPEIHIPVQGKDAVILPEMVTIRQKFDAFRIENPDQYLKKTLERDVTDKQKLKGKRIAVTVGSRGIPHLAAVVKTICEKLQNWEAKPFIVPAMGSHGGASAEGQKELIASYGITEEAMGVPVISSMETVPYAAINGMTVYCDKMAFEADGVVVFNKIKPHTEFRGEYESGLCKMIAIGLGKHKGASAFHKAGFENFAALLPRVGQAFISTGKLCFGVGVVQNAYDDICDIAVCEADNFLETDRKLQSIAKEKMAHFLFDHFDLLIVDEIGKNISGTGCDPNVVGRNLSGTFHDMLDLQKIFIRGLTEESHHSGVGLGMADMTTRACLNDVDWDITWANVMTTGNMDGGRIPLYANNDRQGILQCLCCCHDIDVRRPKIVRIKNTLALDKIQVSVPLYEEICGISGIELLNDAREMQFDENDNLLE